MEESAQGDPESPLLWTTKSVKKLSGELTRPGHRCSPQTVWRLLSASGVHHAGQRRVAEGRRHPDRDAQFRYIAAQAKEHLAAGEPVISVDARKKEQVGEYAQAGAEWRPRATRCRSATTVFADRRVGHAIPYGVCDVAANAGFVNVGTGGNTAALAVESIRRWWQLAGKDAYPQATGCWSPATPAGLTAGRTGHGRPGSRNWRPETGLEITVCHFPPGTSKWNKIEHGCSARSPWAGADGR